MDDNLSDVADGIFVDEVVGGAIAAVPGCFEVYEDLNFSTLSGGLYGLGVFVADGEGLFHHDGDTMAGAGFDYGAMIECICVNENGLRLGFVEHVLDIREEKVWSETEFLGDEFREFFVGFGDADDLDVRAALILLEKAANVAMNESSDSDAQWG